MEKYIYFITIDSPRTMPEVTPYDKEKDALSNYKSMKIGLEAMGDVTIYNDSPDLKCVSCYDKGIWSVTFEKRELM